MRSEPGRSASMPLMLIAMTLRMFMGMVFAPTKASNAVWLCPLAGWLICLPFLWCIKHAACLGPRSAWKNLGESCPAVLLRAVSALLGVVLIYDAAVVMRMLANTAGVVALSSAPGVYLMLPLILLVGAALMLDSDALGNSARIWLYVLPLLLVVMIIAQLRSFEPGWILPIFGGGAGTILQGAIDCAGWMALTSLMWLTAVPDRRKGRLITVSFISAVAAAALLILLVMLCPTLVDTQFTRAERLQLLLSNGRVELSLQLVLILIWYADLLYLLCAQAQSACIFLCGAMGKTPNRRFCILTALATGVLAMQDLAGDRLASRAAHGLYGLIGGCVLIVLLAAYPKRGGGKKCDLEN